MRYARALPKGPRLIAALLLALISTACTSAGQQRIIARELPPKPSFAVPVSVQRPPDGTDWQEVAKLEQNARKANAARLVRFGAWYDERRVEFASGD